MSRMKPPASVRSRRKPFEISGLRFYHPWHGLCNLRSGANNQSVGGNMIVVNRLIAGLGLGVTMTMGAIAVPAIAADDTIKVGVLHSLSGTMAISETTLKDTMLFLIDEQNKKGGLLGKQLEAVVVDP